MIPVKFKSSDCTINAYFFPSDPDLVIATIIFLQGFPGVEGDELICEKLAQVGAQVLTFNYRGTFQSEGYFSFMNVISDIGAGLRFIKKLEVLRMNHIDPEKIVLGGWSFGGSMVLVGAVQYPDFRRIFKISGRNFGKEARKIEKDPKYADQVASNLEFLRTPKGPVNFKADMITNLVENQDTFDYEKLAPLLEDRDILLIDGWDDEMAPIEEHTLPFYRTLVENGAKDIRIEAVQDGHEFINSQDQIVQIILRWLKRE